MHRAFVLLLYRGTASYSTVAANAAASSGDYAGRARQATRSGATIWVSVHIREVG